MDENLTSDIHLADFIVDLSNVVRMGAHPGLTYFDRLLSALKIREKDPGVRVYAVADKSLLGLRGLSRDDRRTLAWWREDGLIEVTGDADPRILELAELTGLRVITGDLFIDRRDEHPWLQGNTEQFLAPYRQPDGRLAIRPVDLGVAPEYKVSESSERAVLKKQGLLAGPGRSPLRAVLDRSWRCPDRRCKVYPASKGSGALLPSINQGGRAICEFHGLELIDDGPRLATTQVKILVDGACVARFTMADGTSVAVGRSPGDGISLASWLAGDEERRISRVHLVLTFHDGALFVRDQSTNGTWLAGRGRTGPAERLRKDRDYRVGPGDVVSIPAPITLTRSGRRFSSRLSDRDPRLTPPRGTFAEVRPTDLF